MPIQKILVPTDFSPGAQLALDEAGELALRHGAEVTLLHVILPPVYAFTDASALGIDVLGDLRNRALAETERHAATMAEKLGRPVAAQVITGAVPHEIVTFAKSGGFDLIVIGTHGYTGLKHFFIGSTAERVVQLARCRVMTVPGPSSP
jgi:nucleotide-binding universal stress UspA family protein